MGRPRVVLAEDHPGVADELRRLLDPEFDVVAVAGDGHGLLRDAEAMRPDVIVTDIVMPGLTGSPPRARSWRDVRAPASSWSPSTTTPSWRSEASRPARSPAC